MNRVFLGIAVLSGLMAGSPVAAQPGAGAGAGRVERLDGRGERLFEGRGQRGPQGRINVDAQGRISVDEDANAPQTMQRLQELLQQYPPSLGKVLALDPTLLTNDAYLQPYPQLATLLAQHPEIAHNPSYFFDPQYRDLSRRQYDYNEPRRQVIQAVDQAFGVLAFLTGFIIVVLTIAWVVRSVMEHRKWLRASKTHVDTHTRLMERLTSNDELIAYMQSPAGRRFLEAAPIPLESGPKTLNAPFGRILWSVQAGVVVAALGVGLIYASTRLGPGFREGELPLLIVGIASLAIGVGFVLSAIMAYALSHRLGLFTGGGTSPTESGSSHGA
jgi:hypothetical protein